MRAEAKAVLVQSAEVTRLIDLAFTRNGELQHTLIRRTGKKFIQMVDMHQLFYRWTVPMMQGIIRNLVKNALRVRLQYTFDSQTMDLYLSPEDLSIPLLYRYPNVEGR